MPFEIFKSASGDKFFFRLKARNGQMILSSQGYTTKAAAMNGAESVKNNCGDDNCYEIKESGNGKFFFNLLAKNKQIIGSSEMYESKAGMQNGIQSVKNNAPDAEIKDLTVEG